MQMRTMVLSKAPLLLKQTSRPTQSSTNTLRYNRSVERMPFIVTSRHPVTARCGDSSRWMRVVWVGFYILLFDRCNGNMCTTITVSGRRLPRVYLKRKSVRWPHVENRKPIACSDACRHGDDGGLQINPN